MSVILILELKSFAVNDSIESETSWHHQMLSFSLEMFCQAFTATSFSCCLFVVFQPSVTSSASESYALLCCGSVTNWAIEEYSISLLLWSFWFAFAVCCGSFSICSVMHLPINTSEPMPLTAVHAHVKTLPPPCLTRLLNIQSHHIILWWF